jgi:hypothetical protein
MNTDKILSVCLLQDVEFNGREYKAGEIAKLPEYFLHVNSIQYVPDTMADGARKHLGITEKQPAPKPEAVRAPAPKPAETN